MEEGLLEVKLEEGRGDYSPSQLEMDYASVAYDAEADEAKETAFCEVETEKRRNRDWDKYPCVLCNKPYKTVAYLQKHMVAKHRLCDPVVQIKCELCGCLFSNQSQFKIHADLARKKIDNYTGAVAAMKQEQLEYSRVVLNKAREDAHEEHAQKKDMSFKIMKKFFDNSGEASS